MKAMLLAAGRGERLRPLPERTRRAMVRVGGKPLIAWHLERRGASGCREAVINVSPLARQIVDYVGDGARFGVRGAYWREPEPLETAGVIAQALPLLAAAPFLLVNADIYCEADFRRLRRLELGATLAHLVLVPNPPHRAQGDFALLVRSVRNEGTPRYTYAGVAVMSPQLVRPVRQGYKAPLAPFLRTPAVHSHLSADLF